MHGANAGNSVEMGHDTVNNELFLDVYTLY
jgi:hypothetical protein